MQSVSILQRIRLVGSNERPTLARDGHPGILLLLGRSGWGGNNRRERRVIEGRVVGEQRAVITRAVISAAVVGVVVASVWRVPPKPLKPHHIFLVLGRHAGEEGSEGTGTGAVWGRNGSTPNHPKKIACAHWFKIHIPAEGDVSSTMGYREPMRACYFSSGQRAPANKDW